MIKKMFTWIIAGYHSYNYFYNLYGYYKPESLTTSLGVGIVLPSNWVMEV